MLFHTRENLGPPEHQTSEMSPLPRAHDGTAVHLRGERCPPAAGFAHQEKINTRNHSRLFLSGATLGLAPPWHGDNVSGWLLSDQ